MAETAEVFKMTIDRCGCVLKLESTGDYMKADVQINNPISCKHGTVSRDMKRAPYHPDAVAQQPADTPTSTLVERLKFDIPWRDGISDHDVELVAQFITGPDTPTSPLIERLRERAAETDPEYMTSEGESSARLDREAAERIASLEAMLDMDGVARLDELELTVASLRAALEPLIEKYVVNRYTDSVATFVVGTDSAREGDPLFDLWMKAIAALATEGDGE